MTWDGSGMEADVAGVQAAGAKTPWAAKKRAAVWRGSTTGLRDRVTAGNWRSYTRAKLALLSRMFPRLLDAQFTARYGQTPEAVATAVRTQLGYAKPLPLAAQAGYRHLVDVEGNSFSDRLRLLLHANSTVFKQEYEWLDFFHVALEPWEHYVPVEPDLSDLIPQLKWAAAHEAEAAGIAARGAAFAHRFLHAGLAYWYVWELVQAYAGLLVESVELSRGAVLVGCV
jgi:hypothetical protein